VLEVLLVNQCIALCVFKCEGHRCIVSRRLGVLHGNIFTKRLHNFCHGIILHACIASGLSCGTGQYLCRCGRSLVYQLASLSKGLVVSVVGMNFVLVIRLRCIVLRIIGNPTHLNQRTIPATMSKITQGHPCLL